MRGPRCVALLLASTGALGACGGGDAASTTPENVRVAVGAGISLSKPPSWRLLTRDITALSWPVERLLLTSYRARPGGNCAPDRAQRSFRWAGRSCTSSSTAAFAARR